jgi:uncharacterized protein YjbJ (UPF0337 family)
MAINRNQVAGRIKQAKGTVEAVAGKVAGSRKLRARGALDANLGKAQAAFGDVTAKATKARKRVAAKVRTRR